MATYTVAQSTHRALTANTVDTVIFTTDWSLVEVKNRAASGGNPIFFTADGTPPAVGGDDTDVVLPGESLLVPMASTSGGRDTVKLKSAGAEPYSVRGAPA